MAMEFANNGGAQNLASVSTFAPPANVTVMFWVRLNAIPTPATANRFFGTADSFESRVDDSGSFFMDLNIGAGQISTSALSAGPWFHIAGTSSTTTIQVFLDGVLDASGIFVTSPPAAATLTIGNRTGSASSNGINGTLADFRIYNRVLSAAEIQTIFTAKGADGIVEGLISHVQFNEQGPGASPSGTAAVKDVSITGNHFTPAGSPVYREGITNFRKRALACRSA